MAERAGLSLEEVRCHEEGHAQPSFDQQRKYAAAFDLDGGALAFQEGWRRTSDVQRRRDGLVPVINWAPASAPRNYEEYGVDSRFGFEYAECPEGWEADQLIAFLVVGDSMSPDFEENDLVYCRALRPDEAVADGTPVFVRFDGSRDGLCTFKMAFATDDPQCVFLKPANPEHPMMLVPREQIIRMDVFVAKKPQYWRRDRTVRRVVDEFAQDAPDYE